MPLDESSLRSHSDKKANNVGSKINKFLGITDNNIDEVNALEKSSKAIKALKINDYEINKKYKNNLRYSNLNSGSNAVGGLIIVASIRKYVIHNGYLLRYTNTNFVLSKSWKKRYFVLAKNVLYCFKSSDPTSSLMDSFGLTDDTIVCVNDDFNGKSWILQVNKPNMKPWYLQADNVNEMKSWLRELKSIVAKLKYRDVESPSNTSSDLFNNNDDDNDDGININVNNINSNKNKGNVNNIHNMINGSDNSISSISNGSSITANAINGPISESFEEEEFFTPKTSVTDVSSTISASESSDDDDKITPISLLPPPRPVMTSLPPPPRPKSQSILSSSPSPATTARALSPQSIPLPPHMISNIMIIEEGLLNNENKQLYEPIKRPSSPVESLSPPITNNLSQSTTTTTTTLEQRRRSNSFKSLRISVVPNSNINPSPKGLIDGRHTGNPDERDNTKQSTPVVMPSWSVRSISVNSISNNNNNNTNLIPNNNNNNNNDDDDYDNNDNGISDIINHNNNSNSDNNNINTALMNHKTSLQSQPQILQKPDIPAMSSERSHMSSFIQSNNTISSSPRLINNKTMLTHNRDIDSFSTLTNNNDDNDGTSTQPSQKTKKHRNNNKIKSSTRSSNVLSVSTSSSHISLSRVSITEKDIIHNNNVLKIKSQRSSSSSSSPTISPSSTKSPSSILSPSSPSPSSPSPPTTPPTQFNSLHYNRNHGSSSFLDLSNRSFSKSLLIRSKSYSNLVLSGSVSKKNSLTAFDVAYLPPPTRPPNVPLPPIPQAQQESVPQPQVQSRLQEESKVGITSQILPSSIPKSTSEEKKLNSLNNSKEELAVNYTDDDDIDPDYAVQLAASRNNKKIEKQGKYSSSQIHDNGGGVKESVIVSGLASVMVEEKNGDGELTLDLQDVSEINNNNNDSGDKNNNNNNSVMIAKSKKAKNSQNTKNNDNASVKKAINDDFDVIPENAIHNNNILVT